MELEEQKLPAELSLVWTISTVSPCSQLVANQMTKAKYINHWRSSVLVQKLEVTPNSGQNQTLKIPLFLTLQHKLILTYKSGIPFHPLFSFLQLLNVIFHVNLLYALKTRQQPCSLLPSVFYFILPAVLLLLLVLMTQELLQ